MNAIVAADKILVPTTLSKYSLYGLNDLLATVHEVREEDKELDLRVVLTKVKAKATRQESAWKLLEPVEARILETRIRESEAIEQSQIEEDEEAPSVVVTERETKNRGAQDYQALVREIEQVWGQRMNDCA